MISVINIWISVLIIIQVTKKYSDSNVLVIEGLATSLTWTAWTGAVVDKYVLISLKSSMHPNRGYKGRFKGSVQKCQSRKNFR